VVEVIEEPVKITFDKPPTFFDECTIKTIRA
jgi:hypothetical protein